MDLYEKRGYLDREFRLFHLTEPVPDDIGYHYHNFDKVILFLKGDVDYIIEGRSYHLEPNDIVLVSRHALHKPIVHPGAPYERYILYLSPDCISAYRTDTCDLNLCFRLAKEHHSDVLRLPSVKMSSLFQSLSRLELACSSGGYAKELYCRLLFLEFLVQLNRAAESRRLEYAPTGPTAEKVLEIMRWISENPAADLTIDRLAARFYLSKFHMMRIFREETGYTIVGYINEKRLHIARELLKEGLPVTEACFRCGFKNYAAFLRAYKKMFGETPREAARTDGRIP